MIENVDHNEKCETSRHKVCKCGCKGKYHGIATQRRIDEIHTDEQPMFQSMGGEVGALLKALSGKEFYCWETICNARISCNEAFGYSHDGGLADSEGKRWWVFFHCDNCNYDWSFGKAEMRVNKAKA